MTKLSSCTQAVRFRLELLGYDGLAPVVWHRSSANFGSRPMDADPGRSPTPVGAGTKGRTHARTQRRPPTGSPLRLTRSCKDRDQTRQATSPRERKAPAPPSRARAIQPPPLLPGEVVPLSWRQPSSAPATLTTTPHSPTARIPHQYGLDDGAGRAPAVLPGCPPARERVSPGAHPARGGGRAHAVARHRDGAC